MKNLINKIKQRILAWRYGELAIGILEVRPKEVPCDLFSRCTPGDYLHLFSSNGLEFAVKARSRNEAWRYASRLAKGSDGLLAYKGMMVIENGR